MNILVITDGHPYTHHYVEMLVAEGHDVFVQTPPTMRQTTVAQTREIDLFDLSNVMTALEDIALVVVIGNPLFSNTRLTQSHAVQLQRLMYDNLGYAMKQANIEQCIVWQSQLQPALKQTMAAFQIGVVHHPLKTTKWFPQRRVLYQWSEERHTVRSIQALDIPQNVSMEAVTAMYGRFLKTLNGRLVNGIYDGQQFTIVLMPFKIPLIQMHHHPNSDLSQRVILNITGGWLAQQSGRTARMEFRRLEGDTTTCLISLHDFVPRLPWGVYRMTQAPMHRLVSYLFRRYWEQFN
ncbi:hypothetical protein WL556_06265 [Staphylococcus intermedius]|uniref:NAD-dependent epimerase/dehydratase, putative n=2 Tax=Staphylococcus intermedius TaxID=1285 RepID=A0A380G3R4_STAIN|nr:hypothetical protein [Staphylococcus intermedius]SUM45789.1 NAD-dependent epimerase/dehydratase, putative [Staphylococcus intermedius NCTC 11048]